MAHSIEHDLGDRASAVETLARGLIVDGLSEAGERAQPAQSARFQNEVGGWIVGSRYEGPLGILLSRLLDS